MGVDLLLAMWIAYYLTRNTVQDLSWKARGEDPPSFRREQQRLADKKAKRPVTDRREAKRFWANAWNDAWENAGERRARGYAQRAERRRDKWAQEDQVAVAEREAHERNHALDLAEDLAHDRNDAAGHGRDSAKGRGTALVRCELCERSIGQADVTVHQHGKAVALVCPPCARYLARQARSAPVDPRAAADDRQQQRPEATPAPCAGCGRTGLPLAVAGGRRWCEPCFRKQAQAHPGNDRKEPGNDNQQDSQQPGEPERQGPGHDSTGEEADEGAADNDGYTLADPEPAAEPAAERTPEPAERPDGQPGRDAQVIHLNVWQHHEMDNETEDHVSETTSLNSALTYTTQMAGNATQAVTSIETSIASLQAGGVSGPTIAALQAAQEAMNTAAAQFQTAHAALQRHIQVQEAYEANADAGTREFVKAD